MYMCSVSLYPAVRSAGERFAAEIHVERDSACKWEAIYNRCKSKLYAIGQGQVAQKLSNASLR